MSSEYFRTARRVVSRFIRQAMSYAEALDTLGFDRASHPSDSDINRAYRQKYIDNRRLHPDTGGDPTEAVKLNVAKDILSGKMKPDREAPGYRPPPRPTQNRPQDREDRYQQEKARSEWADKNSPPKEDGESFRSAVGGVDWKVCASVGNGTSDYKVVNSPVGPMSYRSSKKSWLLIGKAQGRYVVQTITKSENRWSIYHSVDNSQRSWSSHPLYLPETVDLLKVTPKIIKEMGSKGRVKYAVVSGGIDEGMFDRLSFTLALKDAVLGSGLVEATSTSMRGRIPQIELIPVRNIEKARSIPRTERGPGGAYAYDWYLSINGNKHELSREDVESLGRHHILMSIFNYDFTKGGRNISRLRGGFMKLDSVSALQQMAKALPKFARVLTEAAMLIEKKKTRAKKSASLAEYYDLAHWATGITL